MEVIDSCFESEAVLTYAWLARELSISAAASRGLLASYAKAHPELTASYLLCGHGQAAGGSAEAPYLVSIVPATELAGECGG